MASSGKVSRSTPNVLAWATASSILRTLPLKSPTVVLICPMPMRSRRIVYLTFAYYHSTNEPTRKEKDCVSPHLAKGDEGGFKPHSVGKFLSISFRASFRTSPFAKGRGSLSSH